MSVQLVLAQRVEQLTVNNRALALNVACDACVTSAVSMQFVIAADRRRDISSEAVELIAQIEAELAARLAATGTLGRQPGGGTVARDPRR